MGKYIHLFQNETEFNNKYNNDYITPWLSAVSGGSVSFGDNNYIRLNDGGSVTLGSKFTLADENDRPRIFYSTEQVEIERGEAYGGQITSIDYYPSWINIHLASLSKRPKPESENCIRIFPYTIEGVVYSGWEIASSAEPIPPFM